MSPGTRDEMLEEAAAVIASAWSEELVTFDNHDRMRAWLDKYEAGVRT